MSIAGNTTNTTNAAINLIFLWPVAATTVVLLFGLLGGTFLRSIVMFISLLAMLTGGLLVVEYWRKEPVWPYYPNAFDIKGTDPDNVHNQTMMYTAAASALSGLTLFIVTLATWRTS